jgi:phosphoserine phosphatase RsbU/P
MQQETAKEPLGGQGHDFVFGPAVEAEILPTFRRVNDILRQDFSQESFVTLIYAVVDFATARVTIANAGHTLPILATANSAQFVHNRAGLPLGLFPGTYDEVEREFEGATLVLYSDGVTEATDASGEEFGPERILRYVADNRPLTPEMARSAARQFGSLSVLQDDATALIFTPADPQIRSLIG